ncbi:RnfABCDGE type electron transport complex subunit B [Anaerotignum propionicum]|jgi:Na+-translocating ferredoxin:NAD+ oxidoreductase RNF subunit RnfB|uniref:Ion-translocating oxidoreductase complex subunit B n=2 Tax=root TaxID=1 RepID=A0A110A6L0_ANAPI|nr:RnfABCDGE type electron transport complex subunit B [Anaerotignum propionicum]AMJ39730.1 electron transport complex subunit RsxB [Anaerotignum propionicum DSM 1682]MEA5056504.1 RnfABCDGE type electron transport complex subunit B [Anaerotignum propionicum]SHE29431.1 electron transport complex, RnfABCDGE type, B subunit [[Clostridium] propionicum DSM 1682] [Anaerotignum propionicum DSM 1682]
MDILNIMYPVLSIGGLGVVFGAGLGIAGEVFKVEEDPKITQILEVLPGANCGGCGFPGCGGLASAIAAGNAPVNGCPVGGAAVAEKVGAIMGVEASTSVPIAAFVKCGGTCEKAKDKYEYFGIDDCNMAVQLASGGARSCSYACLGLGSCKKACAFDAIEIQDGIAVIDKDKCVACGKCVSTCPKHIIEMLPAKNKIKVQCSSKDIGKNVMQVCSVGCIACKICEKNCPFDAIHVIDNLAVIDYDKCKACGICANKCPKGTITGKKPVPPAQAAPKAEAPKTEAPKEEAPAKEEAKAE